MKIDVLNREKKVVESVDAPGKIFDAPWREDLVYRAMTAQLANSRADIAKTKGRSDVRGGGRKPWRQKGTGRARHGSIRSPIWKGGGVAFGGAGRVYAKKINKKERRLALRSLLSKKYEEGEVTVIEPIMMDKISARSALEALSPFMEGKSLLFVARNDNKKAYLSLRNVEGVDVAMAANLNVLELLNHKYVVIERGALEEIPV